MALALLLPACGGDAGSASSSTTVGNPADTVAAATTAPDGVEQDAAPPPSTTLGSTTRAPTTLTPDVSSTALPAWAVAAQFSGFMTAAGLSPSCYLASSDEPLVVATTTDVGERAEPVSVVERGTTVAVCFLGFGDDSPVDATIVLPDGRMERLQPRYEGMYRLIGRNDPIGRWTVQAEQNGRFAETTFDVVAASRPHARVMPLSTLDYFFFEFPQVAPGEPHHVLFTGFEAGDSIEARLYAGYSQEVGYVGRLDVRMDANGSAILTLPTAPDDHDLWRCLALDPQLERRLYPEAPDDALGSMFCRDRPFTTVGATAAIVGLTCDGLMCRDLQDVWEPQPSWQVVGVEPDDPDGGLNVRAAPGVAPGNTRAVLRWDAAGFAVERQEGQWSEIKLHGWVDDAFLELDPTTSCPAGLLPMRVTGLQSDSGLRLPVARTWQDDDGAVLGALEATASGVCAAASPYGETRRQVTVHGWVNSAFVLQENP